MWAKFFGACCVFATGGLERESFAFVDKAKKSPDLPGFFKIISPWDYIPTSPYFQAYQQNPIFSF